MLKLLNSAWSWITRPSEVEVPDSDLVGIINRVRSQHGRGGVWEDLGADLAASVQAAHQARRDAVGHLGPPGSWTLHDRVVATGNPVSRSRRMAELCAECTGISDACRRWLAKDIDRRVLLDPEWTHAGAAIEKNESSGRSYATVVFWR